MNKFEKLVEYIINEDEEKAQELFHEIVVEKSREIYNDLVSESEDQTDDFVADIEADEYGTDMHAEDEDEDNMDDMEDEGDEQEEADMEEIEDRVVDLEAELDALKAEFDEMMSDEAGDEEPEMEMEAEEELDMFEDSDEAVEEDEEELEEGEEIVREYTEKVAAPKGEDHKADSTVAKPNNMGGTASNIAQGGEETGGKAAPAKPMSTGNKNVPGGKQGLEKAPAPKKGE